MRLKIIAGNLVILVLVGLAAYFYASSSLSATLGSRLEAQVTHDVALLEQSWRLSANELVDQVVSRTAGEDARQALRGLDDTSRRRAAHSFANDVSAWFGNPARGRVGRPDVVAITDETGDILARDQNPNQDVGRSIATEISGLRAVLRGAPGFGTWTYDTKLFQVAMAPITNSAGAVIGALVVGYDISTGVAEGHAETLGHEVAFISGDTVYSASVPIEWAQSIKPDSTGTLTRASVDGNDYVVMSGTLSNTGEALGFMIFASATDYLAPLGALQMILLFFGVAAVLMIGFGFVLGGILSRPIEVMEEGILNVINGNDSTRIDIEGGEYGGLAYRINQLIAFSIEGRGSNADWGDASEFSSSAPQAESDDEAGAAAQALAGEDKDAYEARVYEEYVAAKASVGEDVSNIPQARFLQRLNKNAETLKKKHGCRMVRFQVQQKGNQVILRPVIIR